MIQFNIEDNTAKHGRTYIYNLHYEIIWTTYNMQPVINHEIQSKLIAQLQSIATKYNFNIDQADINKSTVHLLVSAKPLISVTFIIKVLKGTSGKWLLNYNKGQLKSTFINNHVWSHLYYVNSLGNSNTVELSKFIKLQKQKILNKQK